MNEQAFHGPLFIVGMPRSGTKLLRTLLNNHPKISIPKAETEILPHWFTKWQYFGDLEKFNNFVTFYQDATAGPYFDYMQKWKGDWISAEKWYNACEKKYSIANVFETLIRLDIDSNCCSHCIIWGDKSPSNIRHIPMLFQIYPNARVIHIVRDVRDYCLSINKAWGKNMLRAAQRWADDVAKAHTDCNQWAEQTYEIRYEDLLEEPEKFLQYICTFLGIDFAEKMLHLDEPSENIGDAKGIKHIVANNKEKWHNRLKKNTLQHIEALTHEVLKMYNYPCQHNGSAKRLSPLVMKILRLADGFNLAVHDTDNRGLWGNLLFCLRANNHTGKNSTPPTTVNRRGN